MRTWRNKLDRASNRPAPNENNFTEDDFLDIMPQFSKLEDAIDAKDRPYKKRVCLVPSIAFEEFIKLANCDILESRWHEKWKYACCLYVAHKCIIYLTTYKESNDKISELVNNGLAQGLVSNSSMGDSSMSYDNTLLTASASKWGLFGMTIYGQELIQEAKKLGVGFGYFV